jgi:hypothetical protein
MPRPPRLIAPTPDVGLSITWGATRVARCAENLTKEAYRQVAFGELQGEGPGMPDEASACLSSHCWRLARD